MSARLLHFTPRRLTVVRDVAPERDMKPEGLWYTVEGDGDWEEWCRAEMPHWIEGRHVYELTIDRTRLLRLASAADVNAFTARYTGGSMRPWPDWERVRTDGYAGVECDPYCWDIRFECGLTWYYGWDCQSGCVWDASAVRSFRYVRRTAIPSAP